MGNITISISGGTAPYTGRTVPFVAPEYLFLTPGTNIFYDIPAGNYQIYVKDSKGCEVTTQGIIVITTTTTTAAPTTTTTAAPTTTTTTATPTTTTTTTISRDFYDAKINLHTIASTTDYNTWGWGLNGFGQLGNNSTVSKTNPVSLLGNKKTFCSISAGFYHSFAIDNYGQIWSWGYNNKGQLGINSTVCRSTPVTILGATKTFCNIADGAYHSFAIDKYGQVWGWGYNNRGQLGINSTVCMSTPVSILGNKKTFCKIASGLGHTVGISKDGQIWGWGYNANGQLGDNSVVCKSTPVSILGTKKTFCQIAGSGRHTLAIDKNGLLWGWGWGYYGQLGNNSIACQSTPVSILGVKKTFCQIESGTAFSIAIDKNGLVWTWGRNTDGQLGDDSNMCRSTPVSVLGAKKTFCKIAAGASSALAIDKYNKLWQWGQGINGQIDNGSIASRLTPTRISTI